ncbi:MAG TPA: AraC family transcriptional regulator [Microbacteriaceae bacterium]|nr:AraC family transcriptional regulator [Microbacteriaceae bacterium]
MVTPLVELFSGPIRTADGRVLLVLATNGGVQIRTSEGVFEIEPGSLALVHQADAVAVSSPSGAPVLGASVNVNAFGLLLDIGFGGVGGVSTIDVVRAALAQACRGFLSVPMSDSAFWNIASLLRIEHSEQRFSSNWESLHYLSTIVKLVGPAVLKSLPSPASGASDSRERRLVKRATAIMEDEYFRSITIPELAERLSVSASTLNRAFKQVEGVTAKDRLTAIRLCHFESLLRETSVSVTEASRLVGFRSSSQIREKFREAHGVSASSWRSAIASPLNAAA